MCRRAPRFYGGSHHDYSDYVLDTAKTSAIKGVAMRCMAHGDNTDEFIPAGIILATSISFPLGVALFDYHRRIHVRFF